MTPTIQESSDTMMPPPVYNPGSMMTTVPGTVNTYKVDNYGGDGYGGMVPPVSTGIGYGGDGYGGMVPPASTSVGYGGDGYGGMVPPASTSVGYGGDGYGGYGDYGYGGSSYGYNPNNYPYRNQYTQPYCTTVRGPFNPNLEVDKKIKPSSKALKQIVSKISKAKTKTLKTKPTIKGSNQNTIQQNDNVPDNNNNTNSTKKKFLKY